MSTQSPPGDRIAKVLARAGLASRREAERMIVAGRVSVNGKVIDRAALNVTAQDKVMVDGKPLEAAAPARLWLFHKPPGLVTTNKDEQGRPTVFDVLPDDLPRVMTVGRLDLNSEGLLLLTNDGAVKRRLELPSTGWLRKYRVRVNGRPTDAMLEPLRKGLVVEHSALRSYYSTRNRLHLHRQAYAPHGWVLKDRIRFFLKTLYLLATSDQRRDYWASLQRGICDARQLP